MNRFVLLYRSVPGSALQPARGQQSAGLTLEGGEWGGGALTVKSTKGAVAVTRVPVGSSLVHYPDIVVVGDQGGGVTPI